MNKFISLIKVDNDLLSHDFNGPESSFSLPSQIDYLNRYFSLAKDEFGFNENKHVVDDNEIANLLDKIPYEKFSYRNRTFFTNGLIRLVDTQKYKNISLFNDATINDHTILMKEVEHNPLPSFEVECEEFEEISFSLYMDGKYSFPLRGGVDTMVPSRNIEFKNGLDVILKIALYSNGEIYAKVPGNDPYHHKHGFISKFVFNEINVFTFKFLKNEVLITVNDVVIRLNLSLNKLPNMFFAGSGLHARFEWSVSINKLVSARGDEIDIFEKNSNRKNAKEFISNLPYACGTFNNRHLSFEFEKEINISNLNKKYHLGIEELGPSGLLEVNGHKVISINDLSFNEIDISSFITVGKNVIKIVVYPQSPENVISWHRNKDPYFASYLGNVYIEEVNDSYIKNVYVKTLEAESGNIFIKNNFDIIGDYSEIKTSIYSLDGELIKESSETEFSFDGEPWSFANPKLYRIIYQLFSNEIVIDEFEIITGFRVIEQKNGKIFINGKEEILTGALLMQYLFPYEDIPLNHVMPSEPQLIMQVLQAKKMNSNCLRMHQLGYGCNDYRMARICDYLGVSSIWTTRFIDTAFGIVYDKKWHQKKQYQKQMLRVINSPSIIMWEGANEYYLYREDIDAIYKEFVSGIKETDNTRLISPVSHLYYANDSYNKGCQYYQDNGLEDEYFNAVSACKEWNDELVVRSAHTYNWLLGYGSTWDKLRNQPWSAQQSLLNSKNSSYIVSEYAIIGRQNPNIKEATVFFNNNSYEYSDELINGYEFNDKTWFLSQAYQSLAATYTSRKMLSMGVDGLLWCCLNGGANDGSYLKPIIDFYGYPKLAFFALKDCFEPITTFLDDVDVLWNSSHCFKPMLVTNIDNKKYDISYYLKDDKGNIVFETKYTNIIFNKKIIKLEQKMINNLKNGYHSLYATITKSED